MGQEFSIGKIPLNAPQPQTDTTAYYAFLSLLSEVVNAILLQKCGTCAVVLSMQFRKENNT
jgi:hypothetical protein